MITTNVDTSDGIANGSTGVLKKITYSIRNNKKIAKIAWIDFGDPLIGVSSRLKYQRFIAHENIKDIWTPILQEFRTFRSGSSSVKRIQLPMIPSFAITIHKSQGGTYEIVIVHLKGLNRQLLYVACSRVTKASGLYLIGKFIPPAKPANNDEVMVEIKRLETECPLNIEIIFPEDINNSIVKFGFMQLSYQNHLIEVLNNKNFDFDILTLKTNESFEIPGFIRLSTISRGEFNYSVYSKTKYLCNTYLDEESLIIELPDYNVIISKVNSKSSGNITNKIISLSHNKSIIALGYFNVENNVDNSFDDILLKNNFQNCNYNNNSYSYCYSKNVINVLHDVYDCYFSKRDCLWFSILKDGVESSVNNIKKHKGYCMKDDLTESETISFKRNANNHRKRQSISCIKSEIKSKINKKHDFNKEAKILTNLTLEESNSKFNSIKPTRKQSNAKHNTLEDNNKG